jgi:hypothetical protein
VVEVPTVSYSGGFDIGGYAAAPTAVINGFETASSIKDITGSGYCPPKFVVKSWRFSP